MPSTATLARPTTATRVTGLCSDCFTHEVALCADCALPRGCSGHDCPAA